MTFNYRLPLLTILIVLAAFNVEASLGNSNDPVGQAALSERLDALTQDRHHPIVGKPLHLPEQVANFYRSRNATLLWSEAGRPKRSALECAEALASSWQHGLTPADYHSEAITALLQGIKTAQAENQSPSPSSLADLDLLLTDGFATFGMHLGGGKINPAKVFPLWSHESKRIDPFTVLTELDKHQTVNLALKDMSPDSRAYWRLFAAAAEIRRIVADNGWPAVPYSDVIIEPGGVDKVVPAIRARLLHTGELAPYKVTEALRYDKKLEAAVKAFQDKNGLEPDGRIGKRTREELGVSAQERLRQIYVNMERLRWLPHSWGERYVIVNTAAFTLEAYDKGERTLEMKVIVGRSYQGADGKNNSTPVFSEKMVHLEINPYWNVPPSIFGDELLSAIKKDPSWIEANHYELMASCSKGDSQLDPYAIDWAKFTAKKLPGCLRQIPGPWNALGHLKFVFPNSSSIYLHDTPMRGLFRRTDRALSHGCIRVQQPINLALFVLKDDPTWTEQKIKDIIETQKRTVVRLAKPTMVHLMYFTAWVDDFGRMQFRKDIYKHDQALWQALNKPVGTKLDAALADDAPRSQMLAKK